MLVKRSCHWLAVSTGRGCTSIAVMCLRFNSLSPRWRVSRVLCSVKCQEMVIVLSVSPGLLVRDSGRMGTVIEEG